MVVNLPKKHQSEAFGHAEKMRPYVEAALRTGAQTLAQIALFLNSQELRTREGTAYTHSSVHRILRRLNLRTPLMSATQTKGGGLSPRKSLIAAQ